MAGAGPSSTSAGGRRLPGAFKVMLTASAFSGFGDGLVAAAFPLLVASRTDQPLLITGVLAAQRIPWVLLALHGGALVDRLPLRRLLPRIDYARAVVVGLLTVAVALDPPALILLVYLAAVVVGAGDTIVASGLQSALPAMVDDEHLERANGAYFISDATTEHLAGPALGGVLFAVAAALPFGVDALTFLVSATLMARVLPRAAASTSTVSVTRDVGAGLRWFFQQVDLRVLAALIGSYALLQGAVLSLLVILVRDQLGGAPQTYGIVLAGAAVGNLVGAAVTERIARRLTVQWSLMLGGVTTGLAYVLLGLAPNAVVATAAMALEGLAIGVALVGSLVYRQRRIPRDMLGRGTSVMRMVAYGAVPVGATTAGALATALPVEGVVVGMGVANVVVALVLFPVMRRSMGAALEALHAPVDDATRGEGSGR